MKRTVKYTEAPECINEALEYGSIIKDFLPPPHQLARREKKEKVTITLSSRSVNLFKNYAQKHGKKYQTMINDLVDSYAIRFL
ncbi:CopG family transcriptional regulator [Alphaproteobacteria bacterium]|nr:CopG family transcriptional regulator [Alphaproteobacteria bacterium]